MIPSARLLKAPLASSSRHSPLAPSSAISALAKQCRTASTLPKPGPTITTLPNKMRVVTDPTPGHFHAVGVYIDAGSRFETSRCSGVSHLIDRLAFKVGTVDSGSADE